MRVDAPDQSGIDQYTEWVSDDLRPDPRCFQHWSEYTSATGGSFFPFMQTPFSVQSWQKCEPPAIRAITIHSLIRSYPIVGMTRGAIVDLIGNPTTKIAPLNMNASLRQSQMIIHFLGYDSPGDDIADYQLTFPSCGCAASEHFQVAYKADRVLGYRLVNVPGEGYGESKTRRSADYRWD
jgi:hypothetical protein